MNMPASKTMTSPNALQMLSDCTNMCESMCSLLLSQPDVQSRTYQLRLLRDCADICNLTEKYMARNSPFIRETCNLCACICECCGNECFRFSDQASQNCGQMCINCAQMCRAVAMK